MTALHATHLMLVDGPDLETCSHRVERFFERTILVKYDSVRVSVEHSFAATAPEFWQGVERGMAANRKVLADLLEELKDSGVTEVQHLVSLPQGYASKTLHTIAHLLDGFIGIDSHFYNLVDDSHWLSAQQRRKMEAAPASYWLLQVEAASLAGDVDQVATLRTTPTARD